jgi:hypothetical protein
VALLHGIAEAEPDLVWGTSSHHIQPFEYYKGVPITYGLGDLLFRHFPGVSDFCPTYGVPCEQYRPELSWVYIFNISWGNPQTDTPVTIDSIEAIGTRHTDLAVSVSVQVWVLFAWCCSVFMMRSGSGGFCLFGCPSRDFMHVAQVNAATGTDVEWLVTTFNELSADTGAHMVERDERFFIEPLS